jgi:diguanylate cyclase
MNAIRVLDRLERFSNFSSACDAVLSYLQSRLGFNLWMVTRTESDDWIVLDRSDLGYGVNPGMVFRWTDSFCSRMVRGEGPHIAPDASKVPAYLEAPIGKKVPIGSYIGVPLTLADGSVFGTLCAIDPAVKPDKIEQELPLIMLLARLLSTLLVNEMDLLSAKREAERQAVRNLVDEGTGLFSRRGWEDLVTREESRCAAFGNPAAVIRIRLASSAFGGTPVSRLAIEQLQSCTTEALRSATEKRDIVAKLDAQDFAVLGVERNGQQAEELRLKIIRALDRVGVQAAVSMARRSPPKTIVDAEREAERALDPDNSLPSAQTGMRSGVLRR